MNMTEVSTLFERLNLIQELASYMPTATREASQQYMLETSHDILTGMIEGEYDDVEEQIVTLRDYLSLRVDYDYSDHGAERIDMILAEANHWG